MQRGLVLALRVVLIVIGGLVLLAGAAASALIGSDDTAQTGPHDAFTPGVAILTTAEALHYVGPTLHLTVEREDGRPVFVGVANEVDAASYVGAQSRRVVSRVQLPWSPTANEVGTGLDPLPAPGQQPWWIESTAGAGPQELVWPIPHGRYSIVVMNVDGTPAVDVQVTLGLELEGAFYAALAVTALGLALVLIGVWLWIRARRRQRRLVEPAAPVPPYVPYDAYRSTEPTEPTEPTETMPVVAAAPAEPAVAAPAEEPAVATPPEEPGEAGSMRPDQHEATP